MVLRAAASVFAPDPSKCLAGCEKPDYQDLIVTKCSHIFCRNCLAASLESKKECPIDRVVLHDINSEKGKEEYTAFQLYLERFTHYIIHDSATLKEKLAVAKAMRISSCELLKADKVQKKSPEKDGGKSDDHCSICFEIPFQMYFIWSDKDPTKVGRHMHEDCWQNTIENESVVLDISVRDLVKVAKQLPVPKELPPEPVKPASPFKVVFVAILLPMSIWALAMNSRIYHNKSFLFFVLSIPALIIFKALSLLINGIKAMFAEKPA